MANESPPAPNDQGTLPDALGVEWLEFGEGVVKARMAVKRMHMAPNGYLHAASVIALADSACGFGCLRARPEGAVSFTTIELKSNFLGSAKEGESVSCTARLTHGGRTTQVWDAEVVNETTGKACALFRCTQMLIYPRP